MSLVRLIDLSKSSLVALSLASCVVACADVDASPDQMTDPLLTSNPAAPVRAPDPATAAPNDEAPSQGTPSPGASSQDAGTETSADDGTASPPPSETPTTPPSEPTPPVVTRLRGTNLVGMEGGNEFNASTGPVPDKDYAVHSTKIIDYLASKKVTGIRFLFSWERMQSTLGGPVPAASSGNYKTYFDDYKRFVDYATAKGMTVVIAPWQAGTSGTGGARWRGNLVGSGTVTSAHFADFWSKMASIYASNPRVAINLVNEPNNMSTMTWFGIAQDAVDAIRKAGFKGDIHVPGNGWSAAHSWNETWYDTASTKRSNAYGWMNARGPGLPLLDPLKRTLVEVHTYADTDAGGSSTEIVNGTTSRTRVKVATDWARANGLKVFVGEIGMYAGAANASANWNSFLSFADTTQDSLLGFAWWACGKPGWWNDVAASGGGHFSITPTGDYDTDTVNMNMIEGAFAP